MRVFVPCAECFDPKKPPLTFHAAELCDSGVVHLQCPHGHEAAVVYDQRRYELLLRSAVGALFDGYASEAASVASGALERAYEFAVRVFCHHRGVGIELLQEAWKGVASQSERQYGAFCFLYLAEFKEAWNPPSTLVPFRNKVIHRGYLPLESEVLSYCESVHDLIRKIERRLQELPGDAMEAEYQRELSAQEGSIPKGTPWLRLKTQIAYVIPGTNQARLPNNFEEFCRSVAREKEGPGSTPRKSDDSK